MFANAFLTPAELAECRADVHYEGTRGWAELVVCRVCGKKIRSRLAHHLRDIEGLTTDQYHYLHPWAPLRSKGAVEADRANTPAMSSAGRERLRKWLQETKNDPTRYAAYVAHRNERRRTGLLRGKETPEGLELFQSEPDKERLEGFAILRLPRMRRAS